MNKVQPLSPNIVLIDITTGKLTREGFQFFQALRGEVSGGQFGSVTLEDVEVFSFPILNAIQEEASPPEISMQPFAEIAALHDRIDELEIGRV